MIGASVDLRGLHMASDTDFNRKSFTTGHTGFGIPFLTNPDRVDVPRSAARALRYLDRYVTVTQGEVFYVTEALAQLEGLERRPGREHVARRGLRVAQELDEDAIVVVQETEYTGAGKHPTAQLTFARELGIEVRRGLPARTCRAGHRDPAEPRPAVDHGVGSRGDQALVPETRVAGARRALGRRISTFLAAEVRQSVDRVRRSACRRGQSVAGPAGG